MLLLWTVFAGQVACELDYVPFGGRIIYQSYRFLERDIPLTISNDYPRSAKPNASLRLPGST
jgi:hypothetical protein